MKKSGKQIWNILSTALVALVVVIAAALVVLRLSGMRAYTVLSGSMEPTYHVGSLVFVRSAEPEDVETGDPITYLIAEDTVVTHRCIEIIPDDEDPTVLRFRTKGDANDVVDGALVHGSNLIGKPVFSVPLIGFAANYIQHPPGTYFAIAAAAVIVLIAFWPDDDKKKTQQPAPQGQSGEENEKE